MKELLEARRKIKGKKPDFIRQDAHKKPKIGFKWRRPKGIHSKMRLGKRGYRRCVKIGWGSPKKIKNFDRSGLRIKLISSIKELGDVNPKEDGILVSRKIGLKKKIELLKKANEMKITILNIKDVDKYLKETEDNINRKKEKKNKIKKERDKKETEVKKKKEKEGGIEKVMSDEEKKKEEKKSRDKELTKKT